MRKPDGAMGKRGKVGWAYYKRYGLTNQKATMFSSDFIICTRLRTVTGFLM